jgi:hypothetical protein
MESILLQTLVDNVDIATIVKRPECATGLRLYYSIMMKNYKDNEEQGGGAGGGKAKK